MKFNIKKRWLVLISIFVLAAIAWAGAISQKPYGIATPYWYSYSSGAPSTYYLEHPTLTGNDQVVAEDATQTLTNKTLTSPTVTGPTLSNISVPAETVDEANVITAAESGATFFLNDATEFQTTLPAISTVDAGWNCRFIVTAAPSSASYTIITGNSLENVLYGGVAERETDTGDDGPYQAAGDTITFVDSVSVVGDWIDIVSDGTYYYIAGQVNADGAVTIAQAD